MARARAAASRGLPGASTNVAECAAALVRVMNKVHAERRLSIRSEIPAGLLFGGDRQDLEEMLGNLLDNACKWAKGRIDVTAVLDDQMLVITVDDDGPGLTLEERQAALSPGVRLDETVPGSGLGLAVVGDLVRLYGGEIELTQSPQGGLRSVLRLPVIVNDREA
jgi:signal transduction histidine kinase